MPNLLDKHDLKTMIKDRMVTFEYFRDNALWYKTSTGFMFPVPVDDVGTATFRSSDRAILFMRWIRKQLDAVAAELATIESESLKSN